MHILTTLLTTATPPHASDPDAGIIIIIAGLLLLATFTVAFLAARAMAIRAFATLYAPQDEAMRAEPTNDDASSTSTPPRQGDNP